MKTKILALVILCAVIGFAFRTEKPLVSSQAQVTAQPAGNPKMIIAKVFIKAGHEAEFIEKAKEMIVNSNKESGCLGYMLYQDPYEKTNFIFVEKYKSQAAIDAHFASSYFKAFGPKISDLTAKATDIKIIDIAAEK